MAVFMINICKFNGCGITFPRLAELIEHIEDVHIDYDPVVVEQKEASQPACIPLSYVLKFITEASKRELHTLPPADVRRRLPSTPKTPSIRSSTPTGSEMDDDELMSQSEDSNDSWTTVEEYSSEFILRYGVKMNATASTGAMGHAAQEKPFACPVPGCKKRYKNVNGIKYHSKNGHKKDGKVKKAYKCQCGKSYKTAQGLRSHSITHHIASQSQVREFGQAAQVGHTSQVSQASQTSQTNQVSQPLTLPGLVVTAAPPRHLSLMDTLDGNKFVRIYDTIKPKDMTPFTIPKHNIANLNIVSTNQNGQVLRHSGILTPNSTPGSSPIDKVKHDRAPKVTVQSSQPLPPTPTSKELGN